MRAHSDEIGPIVRPESCYFGVAKCPDGDPPATIVRDCGADLVAPPMQGSPARGVVAHMTRFLEDAGAIDQGGPSKR